MERTAHRIHPRRDENPVFGIYKNLTFEVAAVGATASECTLTHARIAHCL